MCPNSSHLAVVSRDDILSRNHGDTDFPFAAAALRITISSPSSPWWAFISLVEASPDLARYLKMLVYIVDLLLGYRALCLFQMERKLVIGNIVFFLSSVVVCVTLLVLAYGGFQAYRTPRYLSGCYSTVGSFSLLAFLPSKCFTSVLGVAMVLIGLHVRPRFRALVVYFGRPWSM